MGGGLGSAMRCEKGGKRREKQKRQNLFALVPGVYALPWEVPRGVTTDALEGWASASR